MLDEAPYPRRSKFGPPRKYPWDELEVGETFEVKDRKMGDFCSSLHYANQSRAPKRFSGKTRGADIIVKRVK